MIWEIGLVSPCSLYMHIDHLDCQRRFVKVGSMAMLVDVSTGGDLELHQVFNLSPTDEITLSVPAAYFDSTEFYHKQIGFGLLDDMTLIRRV